jgi:hypothetical protein
VRLCRIKSEFRPPIRELKTSLSSAVTSRRIDDKRFKGLQIEIAAEDGAHGLGFGLVDDELIGFAGVSLGIERIEFQRQAACRGITGVDGAMQKFGSRAIAPSLSCADRSPKNRGRVPLGAGNVQRGNWKTTPLLKL